MNTLLLCYQLYRLHRYISIPVKWQWIWRTMLLIILFDNFKNMTHAFVCFDLFLFVCLFLFCFVLFFYFFLVSAGSLSISLPPIQDKQMRTETSYFTSIPGPETHWFWTHFYKTDGKKKFSWGTMSLARSCLKILLN